MRADYAAVESLVAVQEDAEALITRLEQIAPAIVDDSVYWHIVLVGWVKNGRPENQARYRVLMQSKRRNRIRAMKRMSLAVWRALPDPVIAYHGVEYSGEDVDAALAWTLDPAVAVKFAKGREVVCRAFPKATVPFYTDRRGEREVIVLDASLGTTLAPGTPTNVRLDRCVTSRSGRKT